MLTCKVGGGGGGGARGYASPRTKQLMAVRVTPLGNILLVLLFCIIATCVEEKQQMTYSLWFVLKNYHTHNQLHQQCGSAYIDVNHERKSLKIVKLTKILTTRGNLSKLYNLQRC